MKKPISATVDWTDEFHPEVPDSGSPAIQLTKSGRHLGAEFVQQNHEKQTERRDRYHRDYKGRIPPPELQLSSRTSKSSSRIRFPSEAFRKGYALIDWGR